MPAFASVAAASTRCKRSHLPKNCRRIRRKTSQEFASITGTAAAGTLFTFGSDPRKKPSAAAIVEKFRAKNIDPEGYTLCTYAAVQVWTQAAAKAGTTDPKKVMDTIKAGAWDTVIGKIEYDAKGDIKHLDFVVYRWDDKGGYAEVSENGS